MASGTFMRVRWLVTLGLAATVAGAQCEMYITQAMVTNEQRRREPRVGEPYVLVVQFNVEGAIQRPYRIRFALANKTYTLYSIDASNGVDFDSWWRLDIPLDGPLPWRIELDPDGVSGDLNRQNNVASGVFEPRYPDEAISAYDWQTLEGRQTATLRVKPNSGAVGRLHAVFGVPTPNLHQKVVTTAGPTGSVQVLAEPHQRPVYELTVDPAEGVEFKVERQFTVEVASVRCNPTLLKRIGWEAYAALPDEIAQWAKPETWAPSDAPAVLGFVDEALPDDYRTSLTPYETARELHCAVMRTVAYESSDDPVWDALESLEARRGNCGNTANLLTTLVRAVGLPARTISAIGVDTDRYGHSWCEIYFPGAGWLPADPTWARADDPDGEYAYYFGQMPQLRDFAAICYGVEHHTERWSIDGLINPFVWTGPAEQETFDLVCRLRAVRGR